MGHKEVPVTHLRKVMLEELQRRNFSSATIRGYIGAVERFARYFGKPPDQLGPEHIRKWQAYLLHERKLAVGTVVNQVAGLRFFFVRTLKRRFPPDSIPYPKYSHQRIPKVLSPDEVVRLIEAAGNLQARAILMALYSTGMRRSELAGLRVEDIDSERMVIHIRKGKGGKDRDVPLCPKLLETLREYWLWKKPKTWLFPGEPRGEGQHLTDKSVWYAPALRPPVMPALRSAWRRTCSAIALPRTYWRMARICPPSRCCSDTPTWKPPASTCIYLSAIWKRP